MAAAAQPSTTLTANEPGGARQRGAPVPGVVLIFADFRPIQRVFRLSTAGLELGRAELATEGPLDSMISRAHVELSLDGAEVRVRDLGSRNGTYVNGVRISGAVGASPGSLIRVGGALLLAVADVTPFDEYGVGILGKVVSGPALRAAFEAISQLHRGGILLSLLLVGETGTGKELAAQAFHESSPRPKAPLSAVNCATIPKDLAERLLFGSRRGAFSGATDAPGHVLAANGGTLFLDEVAELPLDVQSKLLRMLETREVMRLGATTYEKVDVRVCAATWRDLRAEVAAGRFREDLYFRIGQPEIRLAPLRERVEEIPWHVQQVLETCGVDRPLRASVGFVEACALRHWPGNVRELRAEVRRAAAVGAAQGRNQLSDDDLAPSAGKAIVAAAPEAAARFPDDDVARALVATQGNILAAARQLGLHRNKVRRWLERHAVEATHFKRVSK